MRMAVSPKRSGANGASAFITRAASLLSVFTRTSTGARIASAAPSSARRSPKTRIMFVSSQSG
jgi:hypothetical protein